MQGLMSVKNIFPSILHVWKILNEASGGCSRKKWQGIYGAQEKLNKKRK
jgi:hypothetical protein